MKNLRSSEVESVAALPKSGYVAAMLCVKAARDYANLHQHSATRQAVSLFKKKKKKKSFFSVCIYLLRLGESLLQPISCTIRSTMKRIILDLVAIA